MILLSGICSANLLLITHYKFNETGVWLKVALEAEVSNKGALALYGRLGFIRAKRLHHYYLNGMDAFRLKLLFPRPHVPQMVYEEEPQPEHEIYPRPRDWNDMMTHHGHFLFIVSTLRPWKRRCCIASLYSG